MTWPSSSVRTKDWASEILTDSDLEGQFDVLHTYLNDLLDGTSGHDHSGADGYGSKIVLTTSVTGTLPKANGGTGLATGFLNGNPIGSLIMWPTASAPTDYLLCDGTAVSRTTYATLFGIIGTTFGAGDSSTTFNLPNLAGKVPVGYDTTDTSFDAIGETGGEKTHVLTVAEVPSPTITIPGYTPNAGGASNNAQMGAGASDGNITSATTNFGGGAHNNLQPYITLNYCIRYQ